MALDIGNITIKSIVWSPVLQMIVMSGGVFISFLISYFKGDISIYMPFISETGAVIPEMGIFSATLVFGSFTGAVMVFYRYAIVGYMVSKENPRVTQANTLCLLCGTVSMAGLVGVAAFPMSSSVAIHVGAAAVHFGPILLYFYLNAYISKNAVPPYYNKLLFLFRLMLSLILSVLLVLLSVLLGVGHFSWIRIYPTRLHATKTPEDQETGMALWTCRNVHCFPRSLGIVLGVGISVVFVIALLRRDVSPYIPYISEAGGKLPESGIFSLFLDITATLGVLTVILRYLIVEECILTLGPVVSMLNKISLASGIVSMMGMFVVSAYPVVSIISVHITGALVLFVGSLLYGFSHAYISYKMCPEYNSILICHTRLMIMIASALAFITVFILGPIGHKQWGKASHNHWTGKKTPDDEGFVLLLVSATAEWIMTFLFIAYYFTYVREFSKISIHLNLRMLVRHFDEEAPLGASVDETSPLL